MPIRGSQMEIAGQICRRRRSSRLLSAITSLPGARRLAGAAEVAGLAAAGLSIVQCVLGLLLAGRLAPGGDSPAADSIFEPVSRIDGTKMLLLAVVAVSAIALARRWTVYGLPQRRAGGRTDRIGARLLAAEPGACLVRVRVTAGAPDLDGRRCRHAGPGHVLTGTANGWEPARRR
jgi:hypothetical protein